MIEMTPVMDGNGADHGVVADRAVGSRIAAPLAPPPSTRSAANRAGTVSNRSGEDVDVADNDNNGCASPVHHGHSI